MSGGIILSGAGSNQNQPNQNQGILLPGGGFSGGTPPVSKSKWDNTCLAYLVPPREDRPFQSPRVLVFSRTKTEVDVKEGTSLPGKIAHDAEVMRRELCDPDHLPCMLVQLDEDNQFMYFAGVDDNEPGVVHRVINARADEITDQASSGVILMPGQASVYNGGSLWRIELDFIMEEEKDQALVDQVRLTALAIRY